MNNFKQLMPESHKLICSSEKFNTILSLFPAQSCQSRLYGSYSDGDADQVYGKILWGEIVWHLDQHPPP